ncbi:glycerol-3-phosphate acyltransferase [Pelobacter sp. M08fum]|uniref:Glycerol-3-phosphate acyltransferase n=2 Tax=Pelovirga terrestris TaxID=2771352 RepID=A0A8J6QND7_9BACT|nr:glycerol-3-phosphate 1-O-acyltransferase PlsY [Pelovirga terrestris]MBD1400777.1 glycerol-3-phosphate acyltransferase [Pelovirga terrestris]
MLVVLAICAYLFGAIPTGLLLTRFFGKEDIRKVGSGNIGATNVYRVAGRKLGLITLVGDCLKGVLPVILALQVFELTDTPLALVALAAFVGHCFPVYLGFKGGKGVATALGIFLVLSPLAVLTAMVVFVLFLWRWRYISLASIAAAITIAPAVYLTTASLPIFTVTLVVATIVIWRHKGNIERLRNGTENRFSF